jgi:hypothetical protein
MQEKIIIFTEVVNFNMPCSVNKIQLKFLFKETVGCSCITVLVVYFTDVTNAIMKRNFLEGDKKNEKHCYQQLHHQQGLFTLMFFTYFYAHWNE